MKVGSFRLLVAIAVGVSVLALACRPAPAPTPPPAPAAPATPTPAPLPASMKVGGGTVGGAAFVVVGAVAKLLEKEFGIPVTALPTEGSRENIRLLDRGQIQLAFISANNAYPAYNGTGGYEKKYTILAPIMGLYTHPMVFVTLKGSPIRSFADLKGKRIGVGTGKTWDVFMKPLFEAHGFDYENDIQRVYAGFSDLYTQLADGAIQAVVGIVSGFTPTPALLRLATEREVRFIGFEPAALDRIVAELPYMSKVRISKDTPGFTEDIDTALDIGGPHLYVRADMDEDLAYRITKLIHQNLKPLSEDVTYFKYPLAHPEVLTWDIGVPFHPGAVRYWKEAGLWKR